MLRDDWKFEYPAGRLAAAATEKIAHHRVRLAFWRATREQVMATIRSEGLEIDDWLFFFARPGAPAHSE